jgi:hypothetical protein
VGDIQFESDISDEDTRTYSQLGGIHLKSANPDYYLLGLCGDCIHA